MFRRLHPPVDTVTISFDGRPVEAAAGESVAAALLAAGVARFRDSAVTGAPRGPWCMIGTCFECLVEIDGAPDRQACQTVVSPGMAVRSQEQVA